MTYSIAGYDKETDEWGVAVQSNFLAVGALVPWVKPGVGVIATQAMTNATFGKRGFELIENGLKADEVIKELIKEDEEGELRQVGIVDSKGNTAAYTGYKCFEWAGHKTGEAYTCQGNMLVGEAVIKKMKQAFEAVEGDLADRLCAALKEAQKAGGDRRGKQSAALLIKKSEQDYLGLYDTYIDLRVDDHLAPIKELKRLLQNHRIEYAPNHKDKFYKFESEISHKLLMMLQDIGFIGGPLQSGETVKEMVYQYGITNDIVKGDIFKGSLINGEVVARIVEAYREYEYSKLEGEEN